MLEFETWEIVVHNKHWGWFFRQWKWWHDSLSIYTPFQDDSYWMIVMFSNWYTCWADSFVKALFYSWTNLTNPSCCLSEAQAKRCAIWSPDSDTINVVMCNGNQCVLYLVRSCHEWRAMKTRDRPKSTWIKAVKNDKMSVILTEYYLNWAKWRKRVHVADPKYFRNKRFVIVILAAAAAVLLRCKLFFLHIKLSFSFIGKDKADVGCSRKEEWSADMRFKM